ncbi:MAG: Holliday junction resolvase RuvX [Candidatus Omnitrophica bacterium]|nr:Holliday junction resolvase RuvX [Candidatus Omnitrophota bacterium]
MRILGIDFGERRIGLAISDVTETVAQGIGHIACTNKDSILEQINQILVDYDVKKIVVGYPYNMNFTKGPAAEKVDEFMQWLREALKVPIIDWDERLTTRLSEKTLIEAGMSRKKRKKVIDMLSAQLILQAYLDSEKNR